jgi:hypothetical protein
MFDRDASKAVACLAVQNNAGIAPQPKRTPEITPADRGWIMQGKDTVDGGFACSKEIAPPSEDRLEGFESFGDGVDVLDVASTTMDPNRPFLGLIMRACRHLPHI